MVSDLELLDLVRSSKAEAEGQQGPAGVGIESIEQHEDDSFTIKLTTGEHKKISLPAAKDGAVGPQAFRESGASQGGPGLQGRDGAAGIDGSDGVPGRDGSFVDTAIVNANGDLLIGLSTGETINVRQGCGPCWPDRSEGLCGPAWRVWQGWCWGLGWAAYAPVRTMARKVILD